MKTLSQRLLVAGILLAGVGLFHTEVHAQSWGSSTLESRSEQRRSSQNQSNTGQVPEWAESRYEEEYNTRSSSSTQPSLRGDLSTKGHAGGGAGIPVDGGLLGLIVAGGGYAGWRLGFGEKRAKRR